MMTDHIACTNSTGKMKNHIQKLYLLMEKNDSLNDQDVNSVFKILNEIPWRTSSTEYKHLCIQACCSSTVTSNIVLIGKICELLTKIIQDVALNEQMLLLICRWCIQSLSELRTISQVHIFTILEDVLKKNPNLCKKIVESIFNTLKQPLENRAQVIDPDEILLSRLKCIRAVSPVLSLSYFDTVKDILVELTQKHLNHEKLIKSEILFEELEIWSILCKKDIGWLNDNIGVLLGVSLSFASYGLPHHIECIPQYLLPTSSLFPDSRSGEQKNGNKGKNRRKQKKNIADKIKINELNDVVWPEINWSQTSDSDFSDNEIGRHLFIRKLERKIRLSALSLLVHMVKTVNKQEVIGYWNNILDGPYSILKTLINDNSPRSRVAIVSILNILFSTNKTYLAQAQHAPRGNHLNYVSWSHMLADLISSTHNSLCEVVRQAQSVGSTLSILQCFIVFIRTTPYHRLNDGLLRNIIESTQPLLKHFDFNVRLACIKCLNEIVVFEPNTPEQITLMRVSDTVTVTRTSDSWIVLYCLETIENDKLAVIIRAECWFLLGNLIKHHFLNIDCTSRLPKIFFLLLRDLQDPSVVVQQKVAKAFEQIAVPLGSFDSSCGIDCYDMWLSMLQGPLVPMLQSTSGVLASAAADCIANITASVFEQLPVRLRIFVMTALCGCVQHEEHVARSAAVRTLGMIVVFPFLSEDIQIIYDIADRIVTAMKDENLTVRTKASWALGNLSDVLLNGRKIGIPIEEVSLSNLLEQAVQTGKDHEKVKACSMRAIGNLLLLVEDHHIKMEKFQILTMSAANALVYNSSSENNMKVRWNACYSLGNMFKNTLLKTRVHGNWMTSALETLSKLVVSCSNFKVRQAACFALSNITNKEFYGQYYLKLWQNLLHAFHNSQNLTEFSEYKHQRNLVDQLCLTLSHITSLLDVDDLDSIRELIPFFVGAAQKHIIEMKARNPEILVKFSTATSHLDNLLKAKLRSDQRESLFLLKNLLSENRAPSTPVPRCINMSK